MNDPRTLALVKRIKEETEKKVLNWEKSTSFNSYRLSLGNGMIVINRNTQMDLFPDGSQFPEYVLNVYNDRDTVIDGLSAYDSTDENFTLLKQIYDMAENFYLKRDDTYESMFHALNSPY